MYCSAPCWINTLRELFAKGRYPAIAKIEQKSWPGTDQQWRLGVCTGIDNRSSTVGTPAVVRMKLVRLL